MRTSSRLLAAAALSVVAVPHAAAAAAPPPPLVELVVTAVDGERLAAAPGVGSVEPISPGTWAVTTTLTEARVDALPGVSDVDPDVLLVPAVDTLGDPRAALQWGLTTVRAREAWARTRGAGAVVAVVDSGVDITHPDLVDRIWSNPAELCGNGRDDDGDGRVDDCAGWDFLNDDAGVFDPADDNRHGTHVAGVVAATAGNGIGVAGVAPEAQIMVLKVSGSGEGFRMSDAARAVRYAADHGADVVNASWGTAPGVPRENVTALEQAVAHAASRGVLVVAAAGNDGVDLEVAPVWPASFPVANVISVAATGRADELTSWSNRGARSVDLAAPGNEVLSTLPGGWGYGSGTSMAAPHVTGAVALLAAASPGAPLDALRAALLGGAHPVPGLAGVTVTGGRLDVPTSLPVVAPEPPPVVVATPLAAPVRIGARSIDAACPVEQVGAAGFTDIAGSVHERAVACMAWAGVALGRTTGIFAPGATVSRGQMASFLARLVLRAGGSLPASPPDRFGDDDGSVHAASIDALAAVGIIGGRVDGGYGPDEPVTRAQMATFLARTVEHVSRSALPVGADAYGDDDGSVHEAAIDALAATGLAAGVAPGRFQPDGVVRRDQMASFLARTLALLVESGP